LVDPQIADNLRERAARQAESADGPWHRQRIAELDGLRGIAILLILSGHYFANPVYTTPGTSQDFLRMAYGFVFPSGVDLFFVLSGFLIGGLLLDNRQATNYFKVFYVRRFYRIAPLYYLLVAIFLGLGLCLPAITEESWLYQNPLPLLSYLTFTQNFFMSRANDFGVGWLSPTWSLAVEEQFYLLLPLLVRFVSRRKLVLISLGFMITAPALRFLLYWLLPENRITPYVLLPCRADALFLGLLAAMMVRSTAARGRLTTARLYGIAGAGLFLFLLLFFFPQLPLFDSFGYHALSIFYCALLLIAVLDPGALLSKLCRNRFFMQTGILAYGLYLFHYPVNGLAQWLFLDRLPHMTIPQLLVIQCVSLGICALLAVLSWHCFEKPLIATGHRWVYRRPAEASLYDSPFHG
jgi:peptidoglycan/LPS O-acetylase OafA/YrhL